MTDVVQISSGHSACLSIWESSPALFVSRDPAPKWEMGSVSWGRHTDVQSSLTGQTTPITYHLYHVAQAAQSMAQLEKDAISLW